MIGNRGDQHYYSIGKWLAGQALLIIIENYQLKHVHLCIITSSQYISAETERVDKNGVVQRDRCAIE